MTARNPQIRNQMYIFPELLADKVETIPHAASFFSFLSKILDLNLYKIKRKGTPPFCRQTLVAVLLYAMYHGHFGEEEIVSFTEDSIGAQWLLCGNVHAQL